MDKFENRRKLNNYIKEENYSGAIDFLGSIELSEEYYHSAVAAYVGNNKKSLAKEVIKRAQKDSSIIVWRRCIYEYAKISWKKTWGHEPDGIIVLPGIINKEQKEPVEEILEVIKPVLLHIEGDMAVSSELEAKILFIAINSFWLLGDIEKVRTLSSYLETKQPASIVLANLAMMGLVGKDDISATFPDRLVKENPDSFNAQMLSILLKAKIFEQPKEAFQSLKQLSLCVKEEDKRRYCEGLLFISQMIGVSHINDAIALAKEHLGKEHKFCVLIDAERFLDSGDIDNAEKIIQSYEDKEDPQWLQVSAFIYAKRGNYQKAVDYYEKVSRLLVKPEVFETLGRLSIQASEKDDKYVSNAIQAYQSLLSFHPHNLPVRHNLAFILIRAGQIHEAKEHFHYLSEHLSDIVYKQNYANCLITTDDPAKALTIYDEICLREDVTVEIVISKAVLLRRVKNPFIAFDFLEKYRDKFWNVTQYIQHYMELASQTNHDKLMNQALVQLKKLQMQGIAPPEVLQEKSIDDLVEHAKFWNERTNQVHDLCLNGRMPWTMADSMLNHAIYEGWFIRTQKNSLMTDKPATIAAYSIYATNAFHPLKSVEDGMTLLQKLEIPKKNSMVFLDFTAILTLQRLELLGKLKEFFAEIYIPTFYFTKLLDDSNKLLPHQRSNIDAIREIKNAIDIGKIKISGVSNEACNISIPYIDEYTIDENRKENAYGLSGIVEVLKKNGLLSKTDLEKIKEIRLNPKTIDKLHPEIKEYSEVMIDLSTLKTICNLGLFENVVNQFDVILSKDDSKQVCNDSFTVESQESLKQWNDDLHNILLQPDFCKIDFDEKTKSRDEFSLAALELAGKKGVSLFCDDRCIQAVAINDKSQIKCFGTDIFIQALYAEGKIGITELTNLYLQLIEWRYKFIVPHADVLVYLAMEYSGNPPGDKLKRLAMYCHNCMRDPGLFSGQEKTADIPLPMAAKLYMEWGLLITDFIVKCWTNGKFDESTAEKYTDWALLYMLPAIPKKLPIGSLGLASLMKREIVGHAIMGLLTSNNIHSGNKILMMLKQKLELSDIEYNRIISEIIDAI